MKKLSLVMMILAITLFSAKLSQQSQKLRTQYPEGYEVIKKHAIEKWGTDHEMILYQINNQCNAFFTILNYESKYNKIVINSWCEWMYSGYIEINTKLLEKINKEAREKIEKINNNEYPDDVLIDIIAQHQFPLSKLHVDWEMALYTAKKQIEAQSAY